GVRDVLGSLPGPVHVEALLARDEGVVIPARDGPVGGLQGGDVRVGVLVVGGEELTFVMGALAVRELVLPGRAEAVARAEEAAVVLEARVVVRVIADLLDLAAPD